MKADAKEINTKLKEANYKFYGWENAWGHVPEEVKNCLNQSHKIDFVEHDKRGMENTASCDVCKIYWKYDSSD